MVSGLELGHQEIGRFIVLSLGRVVVSRPGSLAISVAEFFISSHVSCAVQIATHIRPTQMWTLNFGIWFLGCAIVALAVCCGTAIIV